MSKAKRVFSDSTRQAARALFVEIVKDMRGARNVNGKTYGALVVADKLLSRVKA
jgi:hypothetical protein